MSTIEYHKRNTELIDDARSSLRGNWGMAIGGMIIYIVLSAILSFISYDLPYMVPLGITEMSASIPFGSVILGGPITIGIYTFYLTLARDKEAKFDHLFAGFNNFLNAAILNILYSLGVAVATIFFVIPGIILSLMWAQAFFIMADNPEISPVDALKESTRMMKGFKLKLFGMYLIFILLAIACIFTLGIGFIFLIPLTIVCLGKFYLYVKGDDDSDDQLNEDDIIDNVSMG